MTTTRDCRMRLRWPNGAEFEAEGSDEFVARESREFQRSLQNAPASTAPMASAARALAPGAPEISWSEICDQKGSALQLRAKLGGGKGQQEACLVLMACARQRLNEAKPTGTQLAKWLRRSGYPIARLDRTLQEAVSGGLILASGSRRARRYELTAPGRLKGLLLAEELTQHVAGKP
jgi:hypothetical protein